jgi:probable HAF family extracellular repeat protein
MKRLRVCVIAALGSFASFVAAPLVAQPSPPPVIDIGRLGPESSFLWAVNNRNQAVGWSELAGRDTEHAILWQGGELIDLGALPDFPVSRALGINAQGQIVGYAIEFDLHHSRAILWDHGRTIDITPPGSSSCSAVDINDRGDIVGKCVAAGQLWRGRELITLGLLPGYTNNYPTAINDAGVVVGTLTDFLGRQSVAYRWADGTLTALPLPPGATGASAEDVNARGTIVGYVTFPTGSEPAIWDGDSVAPLSGAWGTFAGIAWGINDRGDVVLNGHNLATDEGGGFVGSRGEYRLLAGPGSAHDINERGVAVGRIFIQGSEEHGAVWPKASTRVPVPGADR